MMWSENWGSIMEWAAIWTLCLHQPSSHWLVFPHPNDLCSKQHQGPHRAPQSFNKHRSVHFSSPLQTHQIYCGSNFLQDQKPKSYKLIKLMRSRHNMLNPPYDSDFCMKLWGEEGSFWAHSFLKDRTGFFPWACSNHTTQRHLSATLLLLISGPSTCREHSD